MTATLHIQLPGHFRLTFDATPVTTLDSPRLQALLAYLLLHRAAPQARAHLAFRLWPDTTEAQAHANLRTLLHRFRHALPSAAVPARRCPDRAVALRCLLHPRCRGGRTRPCPSRSGRAC